MQYCGDSKRSGSETCDDCNTNDGDGCSIVETAKDQVQRLAMTVTQTMEMDAVLHVHLWSQAGFDQADQLLQVTHVHFVHQAGIKTMRQHQQHDPHIEVTERKLVQNSVTVEIL